MEVCDLILTVLGNTVEAATSLRQEHNKSRFLRAKTLSPNASRETTPSGPLEDSDGVGGDRRYEGLILSFEQPPKNLERGFVFGTNPRTCDVLLDNNKDFGISRDHFSISFDDHGRLLFTDCSSNGTAVAFNGQNQWEWRRRFSWILFPDLEAISVVIKRGWNTKRDWNTRNKFFQLILKLPDHSSCRQKYRMRVQAYLDASKQAMPPVNQLGVQSETSTAQSSRPRSPHSSDPIYFREKDIGKGEFGTVYKVVNVSNGKVYAMKRFRTRTEFAREIEIMRGIKHPYIVPFVEFIPTPKPFLLMEYFPLGSLAAEILRLPFTPSETAQVCSRSLQALEYLHSNSITHRDIKPENILVESRTPTLLIRLADFGLSNNTTALRTFCGTALYAAPEISNKDIYSNTVDIWSLGVVILQLLVGLPEDLSWWKPVIRCQTIIRHLDDWRAREDDEDKLLNLLARMLQYDQAKRPSARSCIVPARDAELEFIRADATSERDTESAGTQTSVHYHNLGMAEAKVPPLNPSPAQQGITQQYAPNKARERPSPHTSDSGEIPEPKRRRYYSPSPFKSLRHLSGQTTVIIDYCDGTPGLMPKNLGSQVSTRDDNENDVIRHTDELDSGDASTSSSQETETTHREASTGSRDITSSGLHHGQLPSQTSSAPSESSQRGLTYPSGFGDITRLSGCSIPDLRQRNTGLTTEY